MRDVIDASTYTNLAVAGMSFVVAGSLWTSAARLGLAEHRLLPVLIVFFGLVGLDRLAAPDSPWGYRPSIDTATDVGLVLCMAMLVTEVPDLVRGIRGAVDDARMRTAEYDRARKHYTQVVRHRVMNPLTVIGGAAETIKAGRASDPAVLEQLCDAIIEKAREIEQVTLEPERRSPEERELDAVPRIRRSTDEH